MKSKYIRVINNINKHYKIKKFRVLYIAGFNLVAIAWLAVSWSWFMFKLQSVLHTIQLYASTIQYLQNGLNYVSIYTNDGIYYVHHKLSIWFLILILLDLILLITEIYLLKKKSKESNRRDVDDGNN